MSVGIVDKSTGERIQTAGNPLDKVGALTNLTTTAKDNAVEAINEVNAGLAGKQNTLTFDDAPTDDSNNPVKSNGIYDALALKQNATDNSLQTTDKTVGGAINEHEGDISSLRSGLTTLDNEVNGDATEYPYADVITIEDAVPSNLADCSVKIEPMQDLHGYDKPWVGGAGDNKLDVSGVSDFPVDTDGYVSAATPTSDSRGWSYSDAQYKLSLPAGSYKAVVIVKEATSDNASGFRIMTTPYSELVNNWDTFKRTGTKAYNFTLSDTTDIGIEAKMLSAVARFMILPQSVTSNDWQPYENICPISGHTEVSVKRDGRNLFKTTMSDGTTGGITYTKNADGSVSVSGTRTSAAQKTIGEAHVTSSMGTITVSGLTESTNIVLNKIRLYDKNNNELFQRSTFGTIDNLADYPTLDRVTVEVKGNGDGSVASGKVTIKVELGETATAWEPYSGKTYTIALGSTIYGGTVDFDSGVMTVDRKYIEFDGGETETWTKRSGANSYQHTEDLGIIDASSTVTAISNLGRQNFNGAYYGTEFAFGYAENNHVFYVGAPNIENAEDFKTYLSNNHLQIVGTLVTPLTVQLTPQQIQLLKGTNTITASTGQISVTVNGVSGSIGQVQEQVNATDAALAEQLPTAPTTDGAYVLTVTVADGTPTYSWESAT